MRIVAAITSRWNSKRLPGKALKKIQGKPLIRHIIDNARLSSLIDEVVVATTLQSPSIVSYCQRNNIEWYAYPNEWNILGRLEAVADSYKADVIVYLWGDCPFVNPDRIDAAIEYFTISTNYFFDRSIPVAVFKADLLKEVSNSKLSRHKMEYINEYMFQNCCKPVCEINTQEDLDKANGIL